MAVQITSSNYNGQTGEVTLYLPTGHTIPFNSPSGTTVNLGLKLIPFTYEAPDITWEYGVFSIFFSATSKTCLVEALTPPDGDGNQYRTIKIGNQIWMSESLKTTKFQDGSPIYYATSGGSWSTSASTTPLYTFVENNSGNTEVHGLLYNYEAVRYSTSANTTTNICPVGWRVPTQNDYTTLLNFISPDGLSNASSIMYPGNEYWDDEGGVGYIRTNTRGLNLLGSGGFDGNSWESNFAKFKYQVFYRVTDSQQYGFRVIYVGVGFLSIPIPSGSPVRCIKN
jgi:uncharacterized protein (TIGR02145 family)